MKTEETLVIIGIAALGLYILSKHSAVTASSTTTTTPAAASAPGTVLGLTAAQINTDAGQLFGWLTGPGSNSASTNSTNGTSPAGTVTNGNPQDLASLALDDLNQYGV